MELLTAIKTDADDLQVEYEILSPIDISAITDPDKRDILLGLQDVDNQINLCEEEIAKLNSEIDRLTNHADGLDYAIAITCGLITGIIDSIFVGKWDFAKGKEISNKQINEKVLAFAKKDPEYKAFLKNKKGNNDGNRLNNAIEFLETKYKLPGDGEYKGFKSFGVTDSTHHLDDFCHHPTLIGMICCVLVQFTGSTKYYCSSGQVISVPIEVNQYGKFVGRNKLEKIFAGIINWFFNVAQTLANRKGHLMSDMAGSSTSIGKGNEGAGIPGKFLSLAKELSVLPCIKDTNFAENLRKAYQNGIGSGKKQLNLGIFNALFEGENVSSKLDMRTEMAVQHQLKKQSIPIFINEILVRSAYFIRRFILEVKEKNDIGQINWMNVIPYKNRTVERMMTIATGTFTAIDIGDAAIRGAANSGGNWVGFAKEFILRVNFVGIGRFAIAVGTDVGMGIKRGKLVNERIQVMSKELTLLNAKVYYKCATVHIAEKEMFEAEEDMWVAALDTEETLQEAYEVSKEAVVYVQKALMMISEDMEKISQYKDSIEEHNPGLVKNMIDTLKY